MIQVDGSDGSCADGVFVSAGVAVGVGVYVGVGCVGAEPGVVVTAGCGSSRPVPSAYATVPVETLTASSTSVTMRAVRFRPPAGPGWAAAFSTTSRRIAASRRGSKVGSSLIALLRPVRARPQ